MKILVVSELANKHEIIEGEAVPRVGDHIGMFYSPSPKVSSVHWYPGRELHESMGVSVHVDVIVMAE